MMKQLRILLITGILTGCSFQQAFSLLSRSDIEIASDEATQQSNIISNRIQQEIETKKSQFNEMTSLVDKTGSTSFGAAYRNAFNQKDGFNLSILAVLPVPEDNQSYRGWLKSSQGSEIDLGELQINADKTSYILNYHGDLDRSSYETIAIIRHTIASDSATVLEGQFSAASQNP